MTAITTNETLVKPCEYCGGKHYGINAVPHCSYAVRVSRLIWENDHLRQEADRANQRIGELSEKVIKLERKIDPRF